MAVEFVRRIEKVSTVASAVPTVPGSSDHTDGTWNATDIYEGELFFNSADNILYTRTGSTIVRIGPERGKYYNNTHNIDAGLTVITHNLGATPRVVQFWYDGNIVGFNISARSTTTITVDTGVAVSGVEVNIIAW